MFRFWRQLELNQYIVLRNDVLVESEVYFLSEGQEAYA